VAADRHRHSFRHPGADQIPDTGSAEIMKEPRRFSDLRCTDLPQSTRAPSFRGSYRSVCRLRRTRMGSPGSPGPAMSFVPQERTVTPPSSGPPGVRHSSSFPDPAELRFHPDPPGSREERGFRPDGNLCNTRKAGIPEEGNFGAEGIPRVQRSLCVHCSLRAWVHRLRVRPWAGYVGDYATGEGRRHQVTLHNPLMFPGFPPPCAGQICFEEA